MIGRECPGFMRSRAAEGIECIEGRGERERGEQSMCSDVPCARFEANRWTQLSPSGSAPSPRSSSVAAYSDSAGGLLVFGGWDGSRGLGTSSGAAGKGSPG